MFEDHQKYIYTNINQLEINQSALIIFDVDFDADLAHMYFDKRHILKHMESKMKLITLAEIIQPELDRCSQVVSSAFEGVSKLQRQRRVQDTEREQVF